MQLIPAADVPIWSVRLPYNSGLQTETPQEPEVPQEPETPQESETPQAAEPVQQVTQPEKESQSVTAAVEPKSENVVQQAPATGDTAGVAMLAVIMAAAGFAAVVTNSRVRKER